MEQGTRLDSTPVSAAQTVRDDAGEDRTLDAAVAALLTPPSPEAPNRTALIAYASWLAMERAHVCKELYPHLGWKAANFVAGSNAGFGFHRRDTPPASTRAASVLALIGCDWSRDRDMGIGDGGESFPDAKAFPHPDARLIDLEQDYLVAHANYVSTYARETEAQAEFARREEPYHEADRSLLLHTAPRAIYWQGAYLRRVLADRFAAATPSDVAVIDNLRRDQLEALLEPVEARDARQEALAAELRLDELEAEAESALDAREDLAKKIYRLPARSLDGLALKARVLRINESDLWKRPSLDGRLSAEWHELALTEIADGVEHLIAVGGGQDTAAGRAQIAPAAEPEVDWHNPPPGFMAFPAGEPTSFINVRYGIQLEAERLHQIALQEVARHSSMDDVPEFARPGRLDQLRRQYRLAELDRLANPERAIPTETIAANGTVYYEDAAGKAHRRPVADWIAFMAQRMNSVARQEAARLFNERSVQDQDANVALDDDLRRTHRLDALHDLAFRSVGVFEAAKEHGIGFAPVSPRTAGGPTLDPILALIEQHRQAYAEWEPHSEVIGVLRLNSPEYLRAEAVSEGAREREAEAYRAILTARPSTLGGLIAWTSCLTSRPVARSIDGVEGDAVLTLASMCDAVLSLVPILPGAPIVGTASPDAALLALGHEFDALHAEWIPLAQAAWAVEGECDTLCAELQTRVGWSSNEALEVAWSRPGASDALEARNATAMRLEAITQRICATPAQSLDGLAVKARAAIPAIWFAGDYEGGAEAAGGEDWEVLNTRSVIDECLRLAGVDWTGRRSRSVAGTSPEGLEAHPDAALIALDVELEAADARMKVADADCDARADAAFAGVPERPAALVFREEDRPFNLQREGRYINDLQGTPIEIGDIEWMSRRAACHEIKRPVRPGEQAWHDFPGHVLDVVPWPEAQARIDEIVAAWEAWSAAKDAALEAHGLPEAEARYATVDAELKSVLDRMAALPARTVEGMHVKLRAFQDAVPHMRGANWGELMLRSLMRDAGVTIPEAALDILETEA